jgi:hypothetical protein
VLTWIGAAGDAFRPAIGAFPGQLGKVATSHHLAGDALRTYASGLDSAQSQADRALTMGRAARDPWQVQAAVRNKMGRAGRGTLPDGAEDALAVTQPGDEPGQGATGREPQFGRHQSQLASAVNGAARIR